MEYRRDDRDDRCKNIGNILGVGNERKLCGDIGELYRNGISSADGKHHNGERRYADRKPGGDVPVEFQRRTDPRRNAAEIRYAATGKLYRERNRCERMRGKLACLYKNRR